MILRTEKLSADGRRRLLAALRRRVPGARLKPAAGGVLVSGLSAPAAADAAPLLENLEGARGVTFTDAELCPLACAPGRRPLPGPLDFRKGPVFIAGPCAVEDEASYLSSARALKAAGVHALRAALFKPRSSPYAFQGLGWPGLKIVLRAKKETGLPLVTEATDTRQVARLAAACDILQVGARNMRNYELLKEIGRSGRPALLKRAAGATLREWLLSAEYLLRYGAKKLILCERGCREGSLDLRLLREAKRATGLPVLADPSHAAGTRERAAALALKALRGGADGLLIEAAANPYAAGVDGRQTVTLETFRAIAGRRK